MTRPIQLKSAAFVLSLVATAISALAIGGTDIIAKKGRPMRVPEVLQWPDGVMPLVNDPARTIGWHPWFSEMPNDIYLFAFEIKDTTELNRLITKLAAIDHPKSQLLISPAAGISHAGLLRDELKSQATNSAAIFSIGSQAALDRWYENRKGIGTGLNDRTRKRISHLPIAHPPTLMIYAAHPAVNLNLIKVPTNVAVSAAVVLETQERDPELLRQIKDFLEQHSERHAR